MVIGSRALIRMAHNSKTALVCGSFKINRIIHLVGQTTNIFRHIAGYSFCLLAVIAVDVILGISIHCIVLHHS